MFTNYISVTLKSNSKPEITNCKGFTLKAKSQIRLHFHRSNHRTFDFNNYINLNNKSTRQIVTSLQTALFHYQAQTVFNSHSKTESSKTAAYLRDGNILPPPWSAQRLGTSQRQNLSKANLFQNSMISSLKHIFKSKHTKSNRGNNIYKNKHRTSRKRSRLEI